MQWGSRQQFSSVGFVCLAFGIMAQFVGSLVTGWSFSNPILSLWSMCFGFILIGSGVVVLVINGLRVG
jgi:hypothetical protein